VIDPSALFRGDTVRVVLYPDPKRHKGPATVESMELRHLFVQDGMVLGASSYDHAWHRPGASYDPKTACAYAYTNFCELVFNCSVALRLLRGYHVRFYERVRFVTVAGHRKAWESGRDEDVGDLLAAVEAGSRIKAAIQEPDGLWSFHPVHLPTVRLDRAGFELFTDQASYPTLFRTPVAIKGISDTIAPRLDALEQEALKKTPYVAPDFDIPNPEFESAYYILRSDGRYARGRLMTDPPAFQEYRSLILYADRVP
jgi:hypothetical protein